MEPYDTKMKVSTIHNCNVNILDFFTVKMVRGRQKMMQKDGEYIAGITDAYIKRKYPQHLKYSHGISMRGARKKSTLIYSSQLITITRLFNIL